VKRLKGELVRSLELYLALLEVLSDLGDAPLNAIPDFGLCPGRLIAKTFQLRFCCAFASSGNTITTMLFMCASGHSELRHHSCTSCR
jgi:hypothetical protein